MNGQTHRIRRQTFDLTIKDNLPAQQLQEDLGRIHRHQLLPLIERCLNQISSSDQLHRIESLELDLGTLGPDNLEAEIVSKLHRQLPEKLAEEITAERRKAGKQNRQPGQQSKLELLALFLRTGSLPWWADPSRHDQIEKVVQALLRTAPKSLLQLLRTLIKERRPLMRMVRCLDDSLLLQVTRLFLPSQGLELEFGIKSLTQPLLHRIESGVARNYQPTQTREMVWKAILEIAASIPESSSETTDFWKQVITRLALDSQSTYVQYLSHLHHAFSQTKAPPSALFYRILDELHGKMELPNSEPDRPSTTTVEQLLKRVLIDNPPFASLLGTLLVNVDRLPNHHHIQWMTWLQNLKRDNRQYLTNADTLQTLFGLLRSTIAGGVLQPLAVREWLNEFRRITGDSLSLTTATIVERFLNEIAEQEILTTPEPNLPIDLTFSTTEEYYVDNAGLVILWPFITVFLQRLELVRKSRFIDEAAAQRGVGLLQYLVTEQTSPPEYLLPLNKLLCGMDPEDLFHFGPPLTEAEVAESNALISSAIEQAPILKNISATGFRGSFLLRKGVIGTRDGIWLLQVEKEPYDLVLERFPWSFSWVKLPWMQAPLRVEW